MLLRLLTGVGLLALGYYGGKQVGQMKPIREDLKPSGISVEQAMLKRKHPRQPMT